MPKNNKTAAITYFYDYIGAPLLRQNYHAFKETWKENTEIPLYTVECLLPNQKPLIQDAWHIRVKDPFIHKESAINWGVQKIPTEFENIIWTDSDMIFEDYSNLELIPNVLCSHRAVQLATKLRHLDIEGNTERIRVSISRNKSKGFHGGAWAIKRAFLINLNCLTSLLSVGKILFF